jgi:hypothetical protein
MEHEKVGRQEWNRKRTGVEVVIEEGGRIR